MAIRLYSMELLNIYTPIHSHTSLSVLYLLKRPLISGGSFCVVGGGRDNPLPSFSHFHLPRRMCFIISLRNPAGIWKFLWRKHRSNVWERYEIPSCLWAVTHALSLLPHILLAILALDQWYPIPISAVPILCLPLYSLYNNTIQIRYVFELSTTTLSPPHPL